MTIKISELGNLTVFTDTTLFPVVNTAGTYTTVKSNGATISSYIESKIIPSQTGNNGKYLSTNGSAISWETITIPATYSNANVTSYLPTHSGNVAASYFIGNGALLTGIVTGGGGGGASITDDTTTATVLYPIFTSTTTGSMTVANVSTTKLQFTPSTGTLYSTEFLSSSDSRLKENIATVTQSTNIVKQMNGVSFNWKESGTKSYGVIAQEIEQILPELVQATDDGFKRVKYDAIIAFLIEAIKELSARIDILENR